MKKTVLSFMLLIIFQISAFSQEKMTNDNGDSTLKDYYIGQKPPGKSPEIFAPGLISTGFHEFSCTFSPDGKYLFFTGMTGRLKGDIYWVDADIIEKLRPDKIKK